MTEPTPRQCKTEKMATYVTNKHNHVGEITPRQEDGKLCVTNKAGKLALHALLSMFPPLQNTKDTKELAKH